MATRKSTRRPGNAKRRLSDASVDRMYRAFRDSPAQITIQQMKRIESDAQTSDVGFARRTALRVLTRSGRQLIEAVDDDDAARAVADMVVRLGSFAKQYRSLGEMIETAEMRARLSLVNRQDAEALLETAEAEVAREVA